ncbi:TIGR00730 family Rossman fold protein [Desulfuromonas sp. CSMB_57]|uniref:LOG family protein n=1 Tax=Desulfuromonas sp. CSMB_57 TaxID=2807629 RepID=UPI001CD78F45|nr:TIGR00730 family Rossman fold protein [Desulfuromonas sp. CSMB_57]
MKRICVNCGSNPGSSPVYMKVAEELGSVLAKRNIGLVYGGADVGLMGKVADTVLQAGGTVVGVIPKSFAHKVSHRGLTELHVVDSMHDRKAMMFELSDGFIALPGGYGTIEEVTELLTWSQLGLSSKPCGIINVSGYFNSLLSFFDFAVKEGFIKQEHRDMLLEDISPEGILNKINDYNVPSVEKWLLFSD